MSHLNGSRDLSSTVYLLYAARETDPALFWRAAGGCIGESICFMWFKKKHLKTAPNIVMSPSFRHSAHYLNGLSWCSRWPVGDRSPPQTPGPYALCHPFPSTSDGPDRLLPDCWHRHGDTYQTSSIYDNIVISPSPTTHIWIWLCSDTCMLHINYKQIIWFGWSLVDLIGTCGILGNFRVKVSTGEPVGLANSTASCTDIMTFDTGCV